MPHLYNNALSQRSADSTHRSSRQSIVDQHRLLVASAIQLILHSTICLSQTYHQVTVGLWAQGHGRPPAGQLIRQQHLKAPLLQVLHLDAHHPYPVAQMQRHGGMLGRPLALLHTTQPNTMNLAMMVHLYRTCTFFTHQHPTGL